MSHRALIGLVVVSIALNLLLLGLISLDLLRNENLFFKFTFTIALSLSF